MSSEPDDRADLLAAIGRPLHGDRPAPCHAARLHWLHGIAMARAARRAD